MFSIKGQFLKFEQIKNPSQYIIEAIQQIQKKIIGKSVFMKNIVLKNDIDSQNLNQLFESHETIIKNLKKIFREERYKLTNIFK